MIFCFSLIFFHFLLLNFFIFSFYYFSFSSVWRGREAEGLEGPDASTPGRGPGSDFWRPGGGPDGPGGVGGKNSTTMVGMLLFPCADGTHNSSNFLTPHAAKCLPEENLSKMKKKMPVSNKKTVTTFWSMSGDFTHRHYELHQTKLYVPDETTFSVPEANEINHR